jgi:guanylate kinase
MSRPLIVCVIGESGTGKTHLASYLEDTYSVPLIESRTDRPPRTPDERGHTFVSHEEFSSYDQKDMIAYTRFGENRYCCLKQDVPDGISTYVIDEFGYEYLKSHFSDDFRIFGVRMFSADHLRKQHVTEERMARDEGKFNLGAEHFDYFIDNDYSEQMNNKYDALYKRIKTL